MISSCVNASDDSRRNVQSKVQSEKEVDNDSSSLEDVNSSGADNEKEASPRKDEDSDEHVNQIQTLPLRAEGDMQLKVASTLSVDETILPIRTAMEQENMIDNKPSKATATMITDKESGARPVMTLEAMKLYCLQHVQGSSAADGAQAIP
ncbi:hypothetical protein VTL71DRAFT_7736 [Oculimacula yallundae]|uniref:Uncharacterized protein n=1 Tax=Oculimacula yallundae TaxID=86028 RepID=A0ABR4CX67_9HELO